MADSKELQPIVERAVAQALDHHLPKLQSALVERVLAELSAQSIGHSTGSESGSGRLVQAVAGIQAGASQKEILRALLDAGSACATRVALFVVKSGAATGWQSRGFGDDEAVKDFPFDLTGGPAAHAYLKRTVTPANIAEMDRRFIDRFSGPANEQILILPLVLKDKVAALLYADGGADGVMDSASLEVLVMATSAWLEVVSLRKQAQKDVTDTPVMDAVRPAAAVQTVSSYSDPFAGHSPRHTPAIAKQAEPVVEVVEIPTAAVASAAAPATATDPFAGMSSEDADTHRKAQRFARLLVDEIKLYNQAKVAEGRRNRDLYDRLKEDIEKSRATYQKRYGGTVAASGDYFPKEVLRSLAEEDASLMGPNFRR